MSDVTVSQINELLPDEHKESLEGQNEEHNFPHLVLHQRTRGPIKAELWEKYLDSNDQEKLHAKFEVLHTIWSVIDLVLAVATEQSGYIYTLIDIGVLMNAIVNGEVEITKLTGSLTFHHCMTDSHIGNGDCIWMRNKDGDDEIMQVQQQYRITGLDNIPGFKNNVFVNDNDNEGNDFVVYVGLQFGDELKNKNLEQYHVHQMPSVDAPDRKHNQLIVCTGNEIIQQLYVLHDHVVASKQQLTILSETIPDLWQTNANQMFFEDQNINLVQQNNNILKPNELPYCGFGSVCHAHDYYDCMQCNNDMSNYGIEDVVYWCCHKSKPKVKLMSIYQGYIPRLFNTKNINELIQGIRYRRVNYF